jgi:hypothetical protein
LEAVAHFPTGGGGGGGSGNGDDAGAAVARVLHVSWLPRGASEAGSLVSVDEGTVRLWGLRGGAAAAAALVNSATLPTPDVSFVGGAAADPHHPSEVAVAADSSVFCWDLRSGEKLRAITAAVPQGGLVRALSYNPNKPWHLATAGDDGRVKVWDLRRLGGGGGGGRAGGGGNAPTPVKVLDGHTHW